MLIVGLVQIAKAAMLIVGQIQIEKAGATMIMRIY